MNKEEQKQNLAVHVKHLVKALNNYGIQINKESSEINISNAYSVFSDLICTNKDAFLLLKHNNYIDIGICWSCGEEPINNKFERIVYGCPSYANIFICESCMKKMSDLAEYLNKNDIYEASFILDDFSESFKELLCKAGDESILIGIENSIEVDIFIHSFYLCIWTDGLKEEVRVTSLQALAATIHELISGYNAKENLLQMAQFAESYITEHQFAQLIGRSKLYNYLPTSEKKALPNFQFLDCHINSIAEDYYADKSFCREANGNINLWNLYNLFTGANKNSYIDKFLNRGLNASQFVSSLNNALKEKQNFWFIE